MKKLKFSLLIAMIVGLSACQKDNITVSLNTAGALSVQLADSTGKTYPNVKIHLFNYSPVVAKSAIYHEELDVKVTDMNGTVSFGPLEPGIYNVVTDTIKKGNLNYLISKTIQVPTGESKNVVLNPFDYVGTVKLTLFIATNGHADTLVRTQMRIALVNGSDFSGLLNRGQVLSRAVSVKSFDADGNVEFDNLPAGIGYYAYIYINDNDTTGAWATNGSIWVTKDEPYSGEVDVNLGNLVIVQSNLTLTLQYYSSNSSSYKPVPFANVALVRYEDFYNILQYSSQSTVLQFAISHGRTNSSGTFIFTDIPANLTYIVYVYYSNSFKTWGPNNFLQNPGPNTVVQNVDGTYLGLN
jgi:hypothetical protein